jgi:beta-lactamase class A
MLFVLISLALLSHPPVVQTDTRISDLESKFALIEKNLDGNLGVYIRHLGYDLTLSYKADQTWYLASTVKIPLAIAILQKVESGELSLDYELILQESDFVDGNGDILWQQPGKKYTVGILMKKMIQESDNCATDMLFRLVGEEELNYRISNSMITHGFNHITSILQVRHDAYCELHENALFLTNLDILYINSTRSRAERLNRLLQNLSITKEELNAGTIEEAFDRYYERRINSGNLESMGLLLERLYKGELLSADNTRYLLDVMEGVTTGDRRIKAGLPEGCRFAHKTGTQIRRAVNVGIISPENGKPIIVAVSIENIDNMAIAEKAFEEIGRSIADAFMQ